jgi:hypothetical protein
VCNRQEAALANLIAGCFIATGTDSTVGDDCSKLKPGFGSEKLKRVLLRVGEQVDVIRWRLLE